MTVSDSATNQLPDVAFTYEWYRQFLDRLARSGCRFCDYEDTLQSDDVLLRHDVDLSPTRAVHVAGIEARRGIESTYFFLVSSPLYNPLTAEVRDCIQRISDLGHDVGLHFSTHQYWDLGTEPDEADLANRVDDEMRVLERVVDPIDTVSFHIPPDWALRRTFEGFESTYEPRFFTDIEYVADSDQRWRSDPPLTSGVPGKVQVLTHPGLWGVTDAPFDQRVSRAVDETGGTASQYVRTRYLDGEIDIGGT